MATLTGQTIATSYEQLLHVDTNGGGATTTLVPVKDGDNGTTFAMQLSTTTICIDNPTASSASQGGILRLQSDDGAVMASGHRLGVIEFGGAEDTSNTITTGARIEAVTDATWSASENGANLNFYTTDGDASQSQQMTILANGNVGIGTAPGSYKLVITDGSSFFRFWENSSNAELRISCGGTDTNEASIYFGDAGDVVQAGITYDSSTQKLKFQSDDNNTALTIDSSERVGIGTVAPGATLEVENTSATGVPAVLIDNDDADQIALSIVAANTTAAVLSISADSLTTGSQISCSGTTYNVPDGGSATDLAFSSINTGLGDQTFNWMYLDCNKTGVTDSGKTANIDGLVIDVDDTATNVGTVTCTGADIDVNFTSANGTVKAIGLDVSVGGADTNYAAIFSGGNVGIGTTSPDTLLEVVGSFAANGPSSTFVTFADGDATPSVATGNIFKHHASTQTINMFDGGVCGQIITVISTAAITYDFNASNLKCGTADIVTADGDVTMWVFDGTNWYLLSWMDVSANLANGDDGF